MKRSRTIFLVSDATGETAYRVMRSALRQFKDNLVVFEWRQGTRTVEQVEAIVEDAAAVDGMLAHSLVLPDLRQALLEKSRVRSVESVDVIGPAVMHLGEWLEREPSRQPGMIRQLDKDYFQRIDAVEFAVEHDDGRNTSDLDHADFVLVGVSRTSKTPLSMYFAFRGWLVGNVPLVPEIEPPDILFRLSRVVALTISAGRLAKLRQEREEWMGVSGNYGDPVRIREELQWAQMVIARGGWPTIDMSVRSVEEAAIEILALVERW